MNLENAISEPFVKILNFHNDFNRNIKAAVGALEFWKTSSSASATTATLPTGSEPWGPVTHWKNPTDIAGKAEAFVAEIGIVRAASAFEDFQTGLDAELNRARPNPTSVEADAVTERLLSRLRISPATIVDVTKVVEFFDVARNCIVHRSGRASPALAELSVSKDFQNALAKWPKRAGKWRVAIPSIIDGMPIEWQPRHAIMASDAFFKLAKLMDASLVTAVGELGIVKMAAHWCFLDENPVPCPAKKNVQTMVRQQLINRYFAADVEEGLIIGHLKSIKKWDACAKEYERRFPKGGLLRDQRKRAKG
ncbi:hypothetical protein ACQZ6V_14845 [Agrobacterium sp. 22-3674b3]